MGHKLKRALAWALAFAMVVSSNAISILASEAFLEETHTFSAEEERSGDFLAGTEVSRLTEDAALISEVRQGLRGEGTEDSPYLIASKEELALLSEMGQTSSLVGYYKLETDITLTDAWTPIGANASNAFRGTFDGQGHTVNGLLISEGTGLMGLFGLNAGTIKNLAVVGSVAGSGTGGILAAENTGKIEKCRTSGSVQSSGTHGGLVGRNVSGGNITECTADVAVTGGGQAGGFAGENNSSVIRYSGASGEVTGDKQNTGGFIGTHTGQGARIENCYAQGKVSGNGKTGGFVGRDEYGAALYYCYASGMVNGNAGAGFEGSRNNSDIVRFCYYNSANTGNRIGIPATAAQLKNRATYSGWDFGHIWEASEGGYPVVALRGEIVGVEISGDGSEDNPYVIVNEAQLQALAQDKLPIATKSYYCLGSDIALTNGNWTPIGGNGIGAFSGVFDGADHTISGLTISGHGEAYAGLFGLNAGTVKNVRVEGTIETTGYAGLLVGENRGQVKGCHVSGEVESGGAHGGLAGRNVSGGLLEACTADVKVKGSGNTGGFAGENADAVIRFCGASGEVSGGTYNTGGFIGVNTGGNARIENCYAQGKVTGSGKTGGFVGRDDYGASVYYCYASGMVNDNNGAGFEGYRNSSDIVRFCYYNSANTGNRIGIPASLAQLKNRSTYSGWDFERIWKETEGGYPVIEVRGESAEVAISGVGSEDNPYLIINEAQLQALAEGKLPLTTKSYYKLGSDIVLSSSNWTPIGGNGAGAFSGIFDGAGHRISNLKISGHGDTYAGLFGLNTGTVKNVRVEGTIETTGYAGLLVGENRGQVKGCHVSGEVESGGAHGGLAGRNVSGGLLEACTADVKVKGSGNTGGFAGENADAVIRFSGASGEVSGGTYNTGGFIGVNTGGNARIENCYAQGKVTGSGKTGGFVGRDDYGASVYYCYASGMVNDNNGAGFEGYRNSSDIVRFCYYNSANTGNRIGIPASLAQLKNRSTYSGWDFERIWKETEGGYPVIEVRGESAEVAINGDGSEENPYVIMQEAHLQALAENRLPMTTKSYYRLGCDIALESSNWTPIGGNGAGAFAGVFDGGGHTVSGLKISGHGDSYAGLFGLNAGTIQNVRVEGSIETTGYAGLLAGENRGKIEACHASGEVESSGTHGGLVGRNASGGLAEASTADVKVKGSGNAGGFAGENHNSRIRFSGASGEVSGGAQSTGGFVGVHTGADAKIENCYAQGKVTGGAKTGGFAGRDEYGAAVYYCYASGMVNGHTGAGFEGSRNNSDVVRFCYYNSANTGNRVGIPASTAQLKKAAFYSGWDFEHIWKETENGYPVIGLRGEAGETEITGDGTEDAPYLITNEAQLQALTEGKLPLTGKNCYRLANDIVLASANWTPIGGNGAAPFEGIFDGQGHTISGLKISGRGEGDTGLFGYITGIIKDLHVSGTVEAVNDAGLLAGENGGIIRNCSTSGKISGSGAHGGLAGRNAEGGVIEESQSDAAVSGSGTAGGLVGENQASLKRSIAVGNVAGSESYAGGLVGQNAGVTENCYAKGNVSGNYAGGLVGRNYYGQIKNSYAAGKANEGKGGGLCGKANQSTFTNSYYCSTTSFCTDTGKGEPLTRAQMKQSIHFVDWDFEKTWGVYETINGGFPFLLFEVESQVTKEQDFWYEVKENRKGYAAIGQDMAIYLREEAGKTVTYTIVYNQNNEVKNAQIPAAFDEAEGVYVGAFHIGEQIQTIVSLTASVADADGNERTVPFSSSFAYQMPLHVEGILEVLLPGDVAASREISLKLKNASGSSFFTKEMDGQAKHQINGLPGGVYTVCLLANGQEYARKEDVVAIQGRTVAVDFTDIPSIANVEAEFYADGQKISDEGLSLNFFEKTQGKSRLLGKGTRLTYLSAGDTIGYSLVLSREAQKKYRNDIVVYEQKLHAGLNVLRFELSAFHRTEASFTLVNGVTGDAVSGMEVSVSQKLNGIHSYQASVRTDIAGNADIEILDEDAVVTFSKKGYTTFQKPYLFRQLQEGLHESIYPLNGIVEFRLSYQESRRIGDEGKAMKSLRPNAVTLLQKSTGEAIDLNLREWPLVYLNGDEWKENEAFTAQIKAKDCEDLELSAKVNQFGNLLFEGTAVQKGALSIQAEWQQGFTSGEHGFALFDANGDRIRYALGKDHFVRIEGLPAGSYRLAAADKNTGLSKYLDWTELTSDDAMDGQYVSEQVTVDDGYITETDVEIPALIEGKRLLNEEDSSFLANAQTARIGDTIHIRSHFAFCDIGVSQKMAELTVPEGTRLVESSVTVDGRQQKVTVSDGKFRVHTDKDALTVRYTVKVLATVAVSELSFAGTVAYRYNNQQRSETLGRIAVLLNEMTIVAPTQTNYTDITVHGVAPKNIALEIYDDDILVGQTSSNKYGAYRADIRLADRGRNKTHRLKVAAADGSGESEAVEVQYGSNTAMLMQFDIYCNGKKDAAYSVKDPTRGIGNITFTYNPVYPVTFVGRFDDNKGVTMVSTVISLTNGNSLYVEMFYNEIYDYWEGSCKMKASEIPNGFGIEYLPISYIHDEDSPLGLVFCGMETVSDQKDGNTVVRERKLTLEDADHTEMMELVKVEKNVPFAPDDTFCCTEIEGTSVYYKLGLSDVEWNGRHYEALQYYIPLEGEGYALYTRGYGLAETSEAGLGRSGKTNFATGYVKQVKAAQNRSRSSGFSKEEQEAIEELIKKLKESDDSWLNYKAVEYEVIIDTDEMYEDAEDAVDLCYEVIDNDEADAGIFDKIVDWIIKPKAKKLTEAEKEEIRKERERRKKEFLEDMVKDKKVKKFVEEELYEEDEDDDEKTKKEKADRRDKRDKSKKKDKVAKAKTIVDPSGFVYETFEENRIEDVTAELYYENDWGDMEFWDAEEYNQVNPQKTDSEGKYGWDVPEGYWQVVYSKEGYETTQSEKLEVPPPQLDVNIGMISKNGAAIAQQSCNYNRLTLVFDKYLQKASITADKFTIIKNGKQYDAILDIQNENVRAYNGTEVVKTVDLVLKTGSFDDGAYQVTAGRGIQTYAGIVCGTMESRFLSESSAEEQSYTVTIPDRVAVMRGDTQLADGDAVYRNDRLQITAKPGELEELKHLLVNGVPFESGGYYTVANESVQIEAAFREIKKTYRIAFDSKGGSAVAALEHIEEGTKAVKPSDPVKEDSIFGGWYQDEACTKPWDFSKDAVTANVILYAKWTDIGYRITLDQETASAFVGDVFALKADVWSNDGKTPKLVWSSSNQTVASVSQQGEVRAWAAGEADIRVMVEGRDSTIVSCHVAVSKKEQSIKGTDAYVKSISDGNFNLDAALEAGDGILLYRSMDERVATVSKLGRIVLKRAGMVEIRVTALETEEYLAAEKRISLTVRKGTQALNGTAEYRVTEDDRDFALDMYLEEGNGELSYESSNPQTASVSETGIVHIGTEGSAIIHVTASETDAFQPVTADVAVFVAKGTQIPDLPDKDTYRVTFDSKGGSSIAAVWNVMAGTKLKKPDDPQKPFCIFSGWYREADGRNPWDFDSDTVNGDMVLYAKWTDAHYAITFGREDLSVCVGDTNQLEVSVETDDANAPGLIFRSSNPSVVSVSRDGTVRAISAGEADITAALDGKASVFGACRITVAKREQRITGTAAFHKNMNDRSFRLDAELAEGDGDITYRSLDETVAIVSGTGKVTLKQAGTTQIKVMASETKEYAAKEFTVALDVEKGSQKLGGTMKYQVAKGTKDFTLDVYLEEGDGTLTYESKNPQVAEIDEKGVVHIKEEGTASILVTAAETDAFQSAEAEVTITVAKKGTDPDQPSLPEHCTKHEYKEEIVQAQACEESGLVIYTCIRGDHSYGKLLAKLGHSWGAWVTAKEPDALQEGVQERACSRCGKKETQTTDKLPAILELNASSIVLKAKQSTTAVKITKLQAGDGVASWMSTDPSVVKVTAGGKITAKKIGSAVLMVTLKSGLSKTIKVKVQKQAVEAKKVILGAKKLTLNQGQSCQLAAALNPITCVTKLKYKSSNSKIVSVSSKGVIKARKKGKAKITVTAGKKKAACTVTVR